MAPDLPSGDIGAGATEYAEAICGALEGAGDDVVVVGHSMGGLTAPLVASMRPVRHVVYLAALLPVPRISFSDYLQSAPEIFAYQPQAAALANADGSASVTCARAAELWYHDAHWETARWAIGLLRPQHWKVSKDPLPLDRFPDVPCTSIVCTEDRQVDPDWSRRASRELLGVEAVQMPGGHCPMVSQPAALAERLLAIL